MLEFAKCSSQRYAKMIKLFFVSAFTLLGCATTKILEPIGGSKADGTVTLAFQYGMYERPVIDWNQADQAALKRCEAWKYKNAERFGGKSDTCLVHSIYGNCVRMQTNITYQCLDE